MAGGLAVGRLVLEYSWRADWRAEEGYWSTHGGRAGCGRASPRLLRGWREGAARSVAAYLQRTWALSGGALRVCACAYPLG